MQPADQPAPRDDRFDVVANASTDGMLVIDSDGIVQYANPAASVLFAAQTKTLVGFHLGTLSIQQPIELQLPGSGEIRFVEVRDSTISWNGCEATLAVLRDVTEQHRNRQMLDQFFEHPLNLHLLTDLDGIIHRANRGWKRLLGYEPEDMTGRPFMDRVHPDDRAATEQELQRLKHHEKIFRFQNRYRHKDGSWRTLLWTGSVSQGDRIVFGVAVDITEREEALREAEHSRRRLEYINLVLSAIREINQLITKKNHQEPFLQRACEILIKNRGLYSAWIALIDPDTGQATETYSAGMEGTFDAMEARLRSGELPACTRRALHEAGPVVIRDPATECPDCPLSKNYAGRTGLIQRLECEGHVYGVVSVSAPARFAKDEDEQGLIQELGGDLAFALQKAETEKQLAQHRRELDESRRAALNMMEDAIQAKEKLSEREENLRTTLNSIGDAVISTDITGRIVSLNPVAESLTGWMQSDVAGQPIETVFPIINEATRKAVESPVTNVLKTGKIVDLANHTLLLAKDGREIPIADSGAPIKNAVGETTGVVLVFRDQTNERAARRPLEESEARFRNLLEHIDRIPVQGYDSDRKVIYWNRASERVYGYSSDEAMGRRLEELIIPPAMRASVIQATDAWLAGGPEIPAEELVLQNKQGEPVTVYSSHILHVTASGRRELYCVDIDLRELKTAENELRRISDEQRLILNSSNFGIALVRNRVFEWVNPQLAKIVDRPVAEIQGQSTRIIYPSEEDYMAVGKAYEQLAKGERYDHTVQFVHADGSLFWCRLTGSAIDPAHPQDGAIWMFEDITNQKEAEDKLLRLSTAIEQSAEAVVITDREGTIQYVNPAFTAITGYAQEEAIGQNPRILKSGKQDESFYINMWNTLLAGEVWNGDMVNKRKDGTFYTEEASIAPVKDASGAITNFAGIKRDITDELQKEELFRQAQKMESVGQLAGGIAHDFNNILQAVIGFSEILSETLPADSREQKNALEILKAARRGADFTRKLLAFSRKQPIDKKEIDLNQAIQDTEVLLHTLLGEQVTLHLDLTPGIPLIRADYSQLSQIIVNLAVNARDAMSGQGRLTLATDSATFGPEDAETLPDVEPGRFVCLSVTDTGCGMPQEVQEHLFEPFFTTKDVGKGTGLGLAVIYGIVKQNRGWIHVYSEEGHGSTFNIYLPVDTRTGESDTNPSGGTSILLVEDDADLRAVVVRMLESADYQVTAFATAEEALDAAPGLRFDLLFSDMVLPGIDGVALADKLRENHPDLPVLLYSGYRDQRERWTSLDQKGYRFLQKPFSVSGLLSAVHETIQE